MAYSNTIKNDSVVGLIHPMHQVPGIYEIDVDFYSRLQQNRRLSDTAFYPLLIVYICLMISGILANGLIIWVVIHQRSRRQLHHLLMINLALSDLLLCVLTMPLTLMEISTFSWPLGNHPFLCRMTGCVQAISVYVSTLTIAAIALDRYHLIVHPTREGLRAFDGSVLVVLIWVVSIGLAAPLYVFRSLVHLPLKQLTPLSGLSIPIESLDYCIENWPSSYDGFIYSTMALVIQFCVPVSIMTFAHTGICHKLRNRLQTSTSVTARNAGDFAKTNQLLSAITSTFFLCWMPLNVFNLVADFFGPFQDDQLELVLIVLAICHLAGVSSVCFNPLFYAWFNQNFQQDFFEVLPCFMSLFRHKIPPQGSTTQQTQLLTMGEMIISHA